MAQDRPSPAFPAPSAPATRRRDRAGLAILLLIAALFLFDFMGLIIKYLSPDYSAAELSAYRNMFGLVPSILVLWLTPAWTGQGRRLRIRQWQLACMRGLAVTVAQFCFYLSLGRMEFASATTINYSAALFSTALAVPMLGERVGIMRWSAVLVGFLGVVMVMGPGRETFSRDAVLPLIAAVLYAFSAVSSRLFETSVPSALVNIYSSGVALVGSLALVLLVGGFSPLANAIDVAWIAAMGCFGGCAVLLFVISHRLTEPGNLAPFTYLGVPLAFVLGWLFFDEAPVGDLFPGAFLIIGAGIAIVFRERYLRQRAKSL